VLARETAFLQTTLPEFQKPEFLVVRQHEEFVWLHDRFEEIEEYAGYIVSTVDLYCKVFMCFISMVTKCHQFEVGTPASYLCDDGIHRQESAYIKLYPFVNYLNSFSKCQIPSSWPWPLPSACFIFLIHSHPSLPMSLQLNSCC
jgi:hypothetical protein